MYYNIMNVLLNVMTDSLKMTQEFANNVIRLVANALVQKLLNVTLAKMDIKFKELNV